MPMRKTSKVVSPTLKGSKKVGDGDKNAGGKSDSKADSKQESQQKSTGQEGGKSSLSRKSGSFRFSFRKKIKDVVRDLENKSQTEAPTPGTAAANDEMTPNQPRFAEVATEAVAVSKQSNSPVKESVEENPLKMVKLKKVSAPEKKSVLDAKRKKFTVPQLRSTKVGSNQDSGISSDKSSSKSPLDGKESETLATTRPTEGPSKTNRDRSETTADNPEITEDNSETTKDDSKTTKVNSETTKVNSETTKDNSETTKVNSEITSVNMDNLDSLQNNEIQVTSQSEFSIEDYLYINLGISAKQNKVQDESTVSDDAVVQGLDISLKAESESEKIKSPRVEDNENDHMSFSQGIGANKTVLPVSEDSTAETTSTDLRIEENSQSTLDLEPNEGSDTVKITDSPPLTYDDSVTVSPEPVSVKTPGSCTESESDEGSGSDSVGEFHSLSEEGEAVKEEPDIALHGPEEYSKLVSRRISFNLSKNVVYLCPDGAEDDDDEDESEDEEEEDEGVTEAENEKADEGEQNDDEVERNEEEQTDEELEEELNVSPSLLKEFEKDRLQNEQGFDIEIGGKDRQADGLGGSDSENGDRNSSTADSVRVTETESHTGNEKDDNLPEMDQSDDLASDFLRMRAKFLEHQKEVSDSSKADARGTHGIRVQKSVNNAHNPLQLSDSHTTFLDNSLAPDTTLEKGLPERDSPHASQDLHKLDTVTLDQDKPVVSLADELQKEEDVGVREEKQFDDEHDVNSYKNRVEKLEKLIKAKENSIKTFITKNDALTSELLGVKDLLYEKDMAFRSVSDSLNVVVERCNHKTKQVQDQIETNEHITDQNNALRSEIEVMKRKVSDLESEVVDYQKLNDENNDAYKNQKQLLRKREEELLELRREFEERIDRQSESTASVRKKAERCSSESEEVKEQLKRLKEKFEKEKDCHFEEIQSLEIEKNELLQKMSNTENQLKKSREEYLSMANNLTFTESDFHALQLKFNSLTKDHTSLKSDLQSNELKANVLTTENKALKKELENLKIDHDTLVQQKVSNNTRIQNLQRDIEDEKDKGLKNSHLIEDLKRQVQLQLNELNVANTRSNEYAKSSLEEEKEMRNKWQRRIRDTEDEVNRLTAKLKLSEKNRSEQCAELEQVNYDLASTKRTLTSLEKKHHNAEILLEEHVSLDQENRDKIETMKRRMNEYQSQIGALKQEKEEDLRQQRDLRNKIKTLQDRVEDLEHEEEVSERKKQEMAKHIARLQEQLEAANGSVTELTEDLEKANSRADKTHKDSLLAMEQKTNVLAEKDEEIEMVKKTCRGTITLLKNQLEAAEQEISKLVLIKKELEGEILLLQGDLDEAEATVNELNNEIPRQQDILEQLNVSLGEATSRCEALQDALVRADLKCTQLSSRNEELEDQVKQGETQKRLTDQDNIDLHNKIAEQSAKGEALLDTIAKVEAQLEIQSGMMESLEADKSNWELERRKMRELITTLEADNQHLEEVRVGLESSENKIKSRLRDAISEHDDILKNVKNNHRARTRALESRVAELEGNLEEETERRTSLEKALKRLERLLKELELQAMEDTQTIERQVEQIANVNSRNKQLKTQFADAEARITSLQQKLRKLTSEVEESEGRNATMTKLLSTPAASRCGTPLRQSAMMRNSVMGSRPSSRLISPEVESIMMSGRNSPIGPLSILSGRNSPAAQLSPGLQRAASPADSIGNQPKNFQFDETLLTKDYGNDNSGKSEAIEGKTESESKDAKSDEALPSISPDDKFPEVILTEEEKKPVNVGKEEGLEVISEQPLWEKEIIVPEKECSGDPETAGNPVNGH